MDKEKLKHGLVSSAPYFAASLGQVPFFCLMRMVGLTGFSF